MTPRNHGIPSRVRDLILRAAAEHHTRPSDILSGSQQRNITAARWQIIRALRADPYGFSLQQIGRFLGGLHHTTVLNALRRSGQQPYASTATAPPPPFDYDNPQLPACDEWAI
jgi:chromosomal replication initiation ATPase DnaA